MTDSSTARVPEAPPQDITASSPESTYQSVIALLFKAIKSRDLGKNSHETLELMREATMLSRSWLQHVEAELQKHGMAIDSAPQEQHGQKSGGLTAALPLVASALLKRFQHPKDRKSLPRRVGALSQMHALLTGHLARVEEDMGRLDPRLEVSQGRKKRRKKRSRQTSEPAQGDARKAADSAGDEVSSEQGSSGQQTKEEDQRGQVYDDEEMQAPSIAAKSSSKHSHASLKSQWCNAESPMSSSMSSRSRGSGGAKSRIGSNGDGASSIRAQVDGGASGVRESSTGSRRSTSTRSQAHSNVKSSSAIRVQASKSRPSSASQQRSRRSIPTGQEKIASVGLPSRSSDRSTVPGHTKLDGPSASVFGKKRGRGIAKQVASKIQA